jgi:hypothetical protein
VKTIFIRLAIIWLMAGQMLLVCWQHFRARPPSPVELEYARDPASPTAKAAMDSEFKREAEYESRRDVGLITLMLAVDGVVVFLFWNFGAGKPRPAG